MNENALKATLFAGLRLTGLLALAEVMRQGVAVLAYHGVTADAPARERNRRRLHVPRARFEQHLRVLKAHATPLALGTLLERLEAGQALPARAVVITFDDGYGNFVTQAWPLLRDAGVPATLFVVTDDGRVPFWQDRLEAALEASSHTALSWDGMDWALAPGAARARTLGAWTSTLAALEPTAREMALADLVERLGGPGDLGHEDRRRLTWDELRALRASGLEVGSHADAHEPLTRPAVQPVDERLAASQARLARELGDGDYVLSYPYGAWNTSVLAAARAAGFRAALATTPRLVRPGHEAFCLGRFLIGADDDATRLRATLAGLRALWQRDRGAA